MKTQLVGTLGDHAQYNGLDGKIIHVEGEPPTEYTVSFANGITRNFKPEEVTVIPREVYFLGPNTSEEGFEAYCNVLVARN